MSDDDQESHNEVPPDDPALTVDIEPTDEAEEEFNPFEEVHERFEQESTLMVEQEDGMPAPAPREDGSTIPVLSPETLVCMADRSKFVMRDQHGYILAEWAPETVTRRPDGSWFAAGKDGKQIKELPWGAKHHLRHSPPPKLDQKKVVEVQPLRPQCKHYGRQKFDFEENADNKVYYRLCSARRTTEGTFMSVGNTGVYACELRNPRDFVTEQQLDDFDALKIEQGRTRTETNIFDINHETPALGEGN